MKSTPPPGYESLPPGLQMYAQPSASGPPTPPSGPPPAPGAVPNPPLDPFSRRLLQIAGVLAVLVILVALNSLLQDDGESPFNPNPIAAAAERTSADEGARFSMDMSFQSPQLPQTMTMSGEGAYNATSGRTQMMMTMQAPAPLGTVQMEAVGDLEATYIRSSMFATAMPAGKEWLRVETKYVGEIEAVAAGNGDPRNQLRMLAAVSDTFTVGGRARIHGAETTEYRATIDFDRYTDLLREGGADDAADSLEQAVSVMPGGMPVTVWIDGKGRVRRMEMTMTMQPDPAQPAMTMEMGFNLYDFGVEPQISLPDPAAVLDASEIPGLDSELSAS